MLRGVTAGYLHMIFFQPIMDETFVANTHTATAHNLHSADPGRHFGIISGARRGSRSYFGALSSIKFRV